MLPPSDYMTNHHAPQFDNKFNMATEYSLPEDLPPGSIVTHLSASDKDVGFAGLIQYTIADGNALGTSVELLSFAGL